MPRYFVGTSGFAYASWRGGFYPPELPTAQFLSFYAAHFPTVELNVTFYRWPRSRTLDNWRQQGGEGFRFVVKVHRALTHLKRLRGCQEELEKLQQLCQVLRPALLLFQLPPSFSFDGQRLEGFLAQLPPGLPAMAWEARHPTFFTAEALAFFVHHRLSLVVADSGNRFPSQRVVTALPLYLRFHGPKALYASPYTSEQLRDYALWVRQVLPPEGEAYAFFNNDVGGYALNNAREFAQLLASPTLAGDGQSS
jgi:uncharacterized protein YecE (DUF72 family)